MKKKDLKIGNETRISILYARITRVHHLSKDDCNLWETSTESHWITQGEENVNVGRGQLVYLELIRRLYGMENWMQFNAIQPSCQFHWHYQPNQWIYDNYSTDQPFKLLRKQIVFHVIIFFHSVFSLHYTGFNAKLFQALNAWKA